MSDELLNILSNSNKDIDNQKLMDYLSEKLSADEKHEVEKQMLDNELLSDALEGLKSIDKENVSDFVDQLNENLKKQLQKKKLRKQKRTLREQPWLYVSIIIVLLLIIISFIVIKKHLDSEKKITPAQHTLIDKK